MVAILLLVAYNSVLLKGEEAESRRAYLSNVCVATSARRKDVGKILIENAESVAFSWGKVMIGCVHTLPSLF